MIGNVKAESINKESIEQEHSAMVHELCKSGEEILKTLTPEKVHLLHMASKLCSEAGELMDAVGKFVYYNKPLDIKNVTEELGDIEFYLCGFRGELETFRHETLQHNINKLRKRYPKGYNDKSAQERLDKQNENPSNT